MLVTVHRYLFQAAVGHVCVLVVYVLLMTALLHKIVGCCSIFSAFFEILSLQVFFRGMKVVIIDWDWVSGFSQHEFNLIRSKTLRNFFSFFDVFNFLLLICHTRFLACKLAVL